jgi:cytochrome c-type biogenesis protein CcmH/NrfG
MFNYRTDWGVCVLIRIAICALLFTSSVVAQDRVPKAIDCPQLLSWVAAGIPSQRLARLVRDRGVSFRLGQNSAALLDSVAPGSDLVNEIRNSHVSSVRERNPDCPAELMETAELVRRQKYDDAEVIVRKLLAVAPRDPDLHLALGHIRIQQGDLDEGFDAYADAKDLNPDFPEIHNGLSDIFYRSNDAENAIDEARTALSIDPENAEAYRRLGLGLYNDENYKAAMHAFEESLRRDPNQAETYYGEGLAQAAEKNLAGAADSYRKAIQLDPQLLEARTKLEVVLQELGPEHPAVAEDANASLKRGGTN